MRHLYLSGRFNSEHKCAYIRELKKFLGLAVYLVLRAYNPPRHPFSRCSWMLSRSY